MSGTIDRDLSEGVLTLTMNRPEKKNALTDAMYRDLADAMNDPGEAGAILVKGAGGAFTSGNDVGDFLKLSMAGTAPAEMGVGAFLMAQVDCPVPMVAAVDGLAYGVGTTMLFQCDLVYASDRSVFRTPFLDLGVVAENASSLLGPAIMGHQRAFELLCLGEIFDADRAERAGFVNRVTSPGDLDSVAFDAAKRLAAKPRQAMKITRDLLRMDAETMRARSLEESRLFGERLKSDEARAAFMAFMSRKAG